MAITLLQLPRDVLRMIMYGLPYPSVGHLVKVSRVFRLLIKDPKFWLNKAIHDFPSVRSESDLLTHYGINDRMRYLDVWRQILNQPYNELRSTVVTPETQVERQQRLRIIRTDLEYIWKQRQVRFHSLLSSERRRLPKVHNWEHLCNVVVKMPDRNKDYPITGRSTLGSIWYCEDRLRVLIDRLSPRTPLRVFDLIRMADARIEDHDIQEDDIVCFGHPDDYSWNAYLVIQYSDGSLDLKRSMIPWQLSRYADGMLRRYQIHSQQDLWDLYGTTRWRCYRTSLDQTINIPSTDQEYRSIISGCHA